MSFRRFFKPAARFQVLEETVENLDGNGLYMEWVITRDNTPNPDEGEVRIANMAPAARRTLHEFWQLWGDSLKAFTCSFALGFDGVASTVIDNADVWYIEPENRDNIVDAFSIFRFGDGLKNSRDQTIGRSLNGSRVDYVINFLVTAPASSADAGFGGLGLRYPKESRELVTLATNSTPVPIIRNVVSGTSTREAITNFMAMIGLEWRVHNGAFIAMRGGLILDRPAIILRPDSGLLRYSKRNDNNISVEALALPDVEPGSQIQVQDNDGKSFGQPSYRVERVEFRGNTRTESLMFIDAKSVTGING